MSRWLGAILLMAACVCWTATVNAANGGGAGGGGNAGGDQGGGPGGPGGRGGFGMMPPSPGAILDFIGEHAADLKLTDEQKAKFAELKKKVPAQPPKPPMNDPEIKDLAKKVRDAMKSGDKEAADAARKELSDKMKTLNPEGARLMDEIKATLTAEQMAKFKELWKAQAPKGGRGGQGGGGAGGRGGAGAPLPPDF